MKLAIADGLDQSVDSNVFIEGGSFQCSIAVQIDVKPGSDTNPINRRSKGGVPVVLLGSASFDVTDVNLSSVTFNGVNLSSAMHDLINNPSVLAGHYQDVDTDGTGGDGYIDLMMHFPVQALGLGEAQSEVCLAGQTLGGVHFGGCDEVSIVK